MLISDKRRNKRANKLIHEEQSEGILKGEKGMSLFIDLLRQVRSTARRIFKMARFPLKESDVIALSQAMVAGLTANAVILPLCRLGLELFAQPHNDLVIRIGS